ncbi:MAG: flp pilus-assembly TadE/G-like family protein [Candidatus Binataceae bacterium]|jgi:hypothetical protein
MRFRIKEFRSQMVVVMAASIVALIGAMALSTDVGLLYYNWGMLQKAADSAVLAGANALPSNPSDAIATANRFAAQNGVGAAETISTTVAADDMSITIRLTRTVPYLFARVVGLSAGLVTVNATAGLLGVGSVTGMLPVGIDSRTTYTYGQEVSLLTGQYGPGNWGPLALGGSGASNFASNVQNGYSGTISVGQMLTTETGKMVGPTRSSFNARLTAGVNGFPDGTFANHSIDDPRIVTVPIVDFANINGAGAGPGIRGVVAGRDG